MIYDVGFQIGNLLDAIAHEEQEHEEVKRLALAARDRGWLLRVVRANGGDLLRPSYTAHFLGRSGELISGEAAGEAREAIAAGLRELSKHPSMKNV